MDGIEAGAKTAYLLLSKYGWPCAAFIVSAYISWRITQWIKLVSKSVYEKKPHWILMDIISWVMAFGMAYWFWSKFSGTSGLAVAFISACLHTFALKALFSYAPAKVTEALQHGVYVDSDHTRFLARTVIGYGGKCTRSEERKQRDRVRLSEDKTEPRS